MTSFSLITALSKTLIELQDHAPLQQLLVHQQARVAETQRKWEQKILNLILKDVEHHAVKTHGKNQIIDVIVFPVSGYALFPT